MKNYNSKGKQEALSVQKNKVDSHVVFQMGLFQTGQAKQVKRMAIFSQDLSIWLLIVSLYFALYIFLMETTRWSYQLPSYFYIVVMYGNV